MKRIALLLASLLSAAVFATPVTVEWKTPTTLPAKVARPFGGFTGDKSGLFLVAGGSTHDGVTKGYTSDIFLRQTDGSWSKVGSLPHPVAEGVSCGV